MPYVKGTKVRLRDKAINDYVYVPREARTAVLTVLGQTDAYLPRKCYIVNEPIGLAWAGDLRLATDKKGLGK